MEACHKLSIIDFIDEKLDINNQYFYRNVKAKNLGASLWAIICPIYHIKNSVWNFSVINVR